MKSKKKKTATARQQAKIPPPPDVFFVKPFLWSLLLPAFALLLYANTLRHGYALDDIAVITQNKIVQKGLAGIPELCRTFYWQGFWNENAGLYRPLSMIMFAAEYQLGRGEPLIHHAMNIALYALSLFFLYRLLCRLLRSYPHWIPVIACLVFAAHPYHTEVVANIKSRDEILCFLFFTLSGIFLLRGLDENKTGAFMVSGLFLFLSLMSKEGGVLFLPVLVLMAVMFRKPGWQQVLKGLAPHAVFTVLWLAIHSYVIYSLSGEVIKYDWRHNSLMDTDNFLVQKATAIGMLGRYIVKSVFPYEFSYDYSYPAIPNTGFAGKWVLLGLAISALALFAALGNFRKRPLIAFGILFFFITIALTSNVFKIIGATMADRFLYVPSLGVALLLAALLNGVPGSGNSRYLPALLAAPLVIFYSYIILRRNPSWKDTTTLYLEDVRAVPNSGRTNFNAATVLLNEVLPACVDTSQRKMVLGDARQYLLRSVELDPREPKGWVNLGVVNYRMRLYRESARATLQALKITPADTILYANAGDAYFMAGLYDSSMYYHQMLVSRNKVFKDTWNFLGSAWFNRKNYTKALECFAQGLKRDSSYSDLNLNYGNALAMNQRYAEAIPWFKRAYALNPKQVYAIYFIALTYQNIGLADSTKKYIDLFNALKGKR